MAEPVNITDPEFEQAMRALQGANRIRTSRSKLKRDLKRAEVRLRDVITGEWEPEWASANVHGLVRACPGYGRVKADALFRVCRLSHRATLESLTPKQRADLCLFMRDFQPSTFPGRCDQDQRTAALNDAHAARLDRAEIQAHIANGMRSVEDILAARLQSTVTMRLTELLQAQHGWGESRTRKFMRGVELPDGKTVGALTDRQIGVIVEALS